jgi:hypothetical protein
MSSIPGGGGAEDKEQREIGGGSGMGARTRDGERVEMSLLPTAGSDIGLPSV